MKKMLILALTLVMIAAASAAWVTTTASAKVPKCSGKLCHPDCPAEVLCATGTTIKSCAQWCGGN